jgi:hypothetical protein
MIADPWALGEAADAVLITVMWSRPGPWQVSQEIPVTTLPLS